MSFPLSNLLVDPSHSKIWLNQLTSKELRDARLVCVDVRSLKIVSIILNYQVSRIWSEFIIISIDLWKKFSLNERPPRYMPKLDWYWPHHFIFLPSTLS
jgi:hypothetical protein